VIKEPSRGESSSATIFNEVGKKLRRFSFAC